MFNAVWGTEPNWLPLHGPCMTKINRTATMAAIGAVAALAVWVWQSQGSGSDSPPAAKPRFDSTQAAQPVSAAESPTASGSSATAASSPAMAVAAAPSLADELSKVGPALDGRLSADETLKAAKALLACKGADGAVATMFNMRDQASPQWKAFEKIPGAQMNDVLVRAQELQRLCQAFDAATVARTGELFARAHAGGAKGSALHYLQSLQGERDSTARPELISQLQQEGREAAESGDLEALTVYSHSFDASLGATEVQRRAYKEAWLRIQSETVGPALERASRESIENVEKLMSQFGNRPPLTAEQQRESDALAAQVVAAWRKRKSS